MAALSAEEKLKKAISFVEKEIKQTDFEIYGYVKDRECLMDYDVEIQSLQDYKRKLENILNILG